MSTRFSMGLRARLVLPACLALVPACALLTYHAVEQRRTALEHARHEAVDVLRQATGKQSRLIAATRQLLVSLAQIPSIGGAGPQCSQLLARVAAPYPYYTNLGVATPEGRVVCSAVPLQSAINIADRSYFRRAIESGGFSTGDYQVGRITDIGAINFGYPVRSDRGRIEGVVYAALNLSWLERLIRELEVDPGITLTVLDASGTILANVPPNQAHVGVSVRDRTLVETILAGPGEGLVQSPGLDGAPRLNAYAPLHEGYADTVYLNVGMPLTALLSQADRSTAINAALLAAAALLALLAVWFGGEALVLRPVRALSRATHRIREGDLNARTGLAQTRGELGDLARDFDAMAGAVQRLARALKTLSAGNRDLIRADNEQELLERMCRTIVEQGGYRAAWVGYISDTAPAGMEPVAQFGLEGGTDEINTVLARVDRTGSGAPGPAVSAARGGRRHVVNNVRDDSADAALLAEAERYGFASGVAFALPVQGRFIGALSIYSAEVEAFDERELALLEEAAGDLAFGIEIMRTRTANAQAQSAIEHMAYYDELTGLPNHASLDRYLRNTLDADASTRTTCGVLLLDLDRFRDVNNAFGFHRGDLLLREVTGRLNGFADEVAMIARLHGDAFVVVVSDTDSRAAAELALRVLETCETLFELDGLTINVDACVGITLCPPDTPDAGQLIRHADVATRHAKASGQPYAFYTRETDAGTTRRLSLIGRLRKAIDNDELTLHYQPKIDMHSHTVEGVEALLRWKSGRLGDVPPGEFVPIAEQTGLIRPLTRWVLRSALSQTADWWRRGFCIPVAVNLSARDLDDLELFDKIEQLIVEWNIETRAIEFEITESAIMHDSERAMETLNRLNQLGIRLFIDDFGTGYSSLRYLQRLPVDAIKIDKSFIADMLINEDSLAIVRATIDLTHDMNLKTVAEGVENAATWDRLTMLNCDFAQGHYISRALPPEQVEFWCRKWQGTARDLRRNLG